MNSKINIILFVSMFLLFSNNVFAVISPDLMAAIRNNDHERLIQLSRGFSQEELEDALALARESHNQKAAKYLRNRIGKLQKRKGDAHETPSGKRTAASAASEASLPIPTALAPPAFPFLFSGVGGGSSAALFVASMLPSPRSHMATDQNEAPTPTDLSIEALLSAAAEEQRLMSLFDKLSRLASRNDTELLRSSLQALGKRDFDWVRKETERRKKLLSSNI